MFNGLSGSKRATFKRRAALDQANHQTYQERVYTGRLFEPRQTPSQVQYAVGCRIQCDDSLVAKVCELSHGQGNLTRMSEFFQEAFLGYVCAPPINPNQLQPEAGVFYYKREISNVGYGQAVLQKLNISRPEIIVDCSRDCDILAAIELAAADDWGIVCAPDDLAPEVLNHIERSCRQFNLGFEVYPAVSAKADATPLETPVPSAPPYESVMGC